MKVIVPRVAHSLHPSSFALHPSPSRPILRRMRRIALALLALSLLATLASADEVMRCESKGNRRKCAFDTPGSVSVSVRRQLSVTECVEGSNWGWRNDEI